MTPPTRQQARRSTQIQKRPPAKGATPAGPTATGRVGNRPAPGPATARELGSPGHLVEMAGAWAQSAARILLGLVLAWFGYHELMAPGQWTGYVPIFSPSSHFAQILVLAHGWVLLVLAVALVAGVAPRVAAAVSSILLVEIVVSLIASGGLSDLVLRDVGVLGLALALVGVKQQRLVLRR